MSASANAPRFYLGVDGGGAKTRAVVVDANGVQRGSALAGGANAHRVGVDHAIAEILVATAQAAAQSGARLPLTAAWLGLAGMDGPDDATRLLPSLAPLAHVIHLTNDAELLLSALPGAVGVALVAGAGSIAVGRNAAGARARVGGWGHMLGDEGSGYDLGRRALIAAVRAADGRGEPSNLLERILAAWNLSEARELIGRVYYGEHGDQHGATLIASLAPLVMRAAQEGDHVARHIVQRGANELARAAIAASDQLGFSAEPTPLALGGSLLLRADDYRDATLQTIRRSRPLGEVVLVEHPALSAARAAITRGRAQPEPAPRVQE
ncbi:MAG TPA: BadF/BadG/BcrA/BcrD ATPase family protein [Ktedonobacterales bacterium]|jgi:N-acetylglucosamine kinase-like BadF-type ATPase|nr:BadF/BadG/BcrA/BcrD ATPase family protein [Ktedonobacterales bacterium]